MSNDQILRYYSDDQWWDLPDDDHHHPHHPQNYEINAINHPLDRHDAARLSTSAPDQYPETAANIQYHDPYPISSTCSTATAAAAAAENLMRQLVQVPTSPAKPKRRRGRGGTMVTTTFLNSTITNFRELVQQHTGMGSSTTPASSYYANCDMQKGPITLCFADNSSSSFGFHHHRNQY